VFNSVTVTVNTRGSLNHKSLPVKCRRIANANWPKIAERVPSKVFLVPKDSNSMLRN